MSVAGGLNKGDDLNRPFTPIMLRGLPHSPAWALIATMLASSACKPGANAASQIAPAPTMETAGQARCGVHNSTEKPLVVEWPASERGALEARAQRGLVAVRYSGCEMEVLTTCTVDVPYDYLAITPKSESVKIRELDELYATLPVGAVSLESKLDRAGELNVDMKVVGRYESPRVHFDNRDLNGRCEDATHVITGLTTGAFEFYTGASAEIGVGVDVAGSAGGGASSSSDKEVLNIDGEMEACDGASNADTSPPERCGAVLRVEVVPIEGRDAPPDPKLAQQLRGWSAVSRTGIGVGTVGAITLVVSGAVRLLFVEDPIFEDEDPAAITGTNVAMISGAVALAAGFFILLPIGASQQKRVRREMALMPLLSPQFAGASLSVSF